METWEAITSRRDVRAYDGRQRWDFVLCTDRAQLEQLSKVWRNAQRIATSAATIAVVAPKASDVMSKESIQYDLGQPTMSIMLAAADLGIGSAHAAVTDQELAREVLAFPEDRFCAWLIALGYPSDRPLKPIKKTNRRPFEDVAHGGSWKA